MVVQRNTSPGASPGGGHGSNPQNTQGGRGQQNNRPTSSPKKEIQIDQSSHVQGDVCYFTIRVTLFSQGNPIVGQEVSVEEGVSLVWNDITNNDGEAVFQIKENIQDAEQIKVLTVRLVGTPDRRPITLTVPAKKKLKPTTKRIAVTITSVVDNDANECHLTFESMVFIEDQPSPQQPTVFRRGISELDRNSTDNDGKITFHDVVSLISVEQIITYRVSLANFPDEEEVNVTIPAAEKKKKEDNDPVKMTIHSYGDGQGNFTTHVRVLKSAGKVLKDAPFTITYKGIDYPCVTNEYGKCTFNVSDWFEEGEEQRLTAEIDGIEEPAKITVRRKKPFVKKFAEKSRKFFIWLTAISWFLAIIFGPGKALINPDIFRGKDGLSTAEKLYNESASKSYGTETYAIKPEVSPGGDVANFIQKSIWGIAVLVTILTLLFLTISIIRKGAYYIEEVMEEIIHKSSDSADDPSLEKLAKYVGSYSVVKKPTVRVDQVVSAEPVSTVPDNQPAAHPAFGKNPILSFIGLDLMMEIALGVLKKVFFN